MADPKLFEADARKEQIVVALMLCHAFSREEALHYLRMYEAGRAEEKRAEVVELERPRVMPFLLKWWHRGKDAALEIYLNDVTATYYADENYSEKGHRLR